MFKQQDALSLDEIGELIEKKRDRRIELRQRIDQMRETPIITEYQSACSELESLGDDVLHLCRANTMIEEKLNNKRNCPTPKRRKPHISELGKALINQGIDPRDEIARRGTKK